MNPTISANSSKEFVRQSLRTLDEQAAAGAITDATGRIDIDLGMPTPGQTAVLDAHSEAQAQLPGIQRTELNQEKTRGEDARRRRETATTWTDLDHPPEYAPERSAFPVRLRQGGAAGVLAAETLLLIDPINESLRGGTGYSIAGIDLTFTGVAGAVTITLLGAYMAHTRAEAIDRSESTADLETRESADAAANRATFGLLTAAAAAIVARIYAATLDAGGIDESGIAFFVLLQFVFVFAALTLPQSITAARRAINRLRINHAIDEANADLETHSRNIGDFEELHQEQPAMLDDGAEAALRKHLAQLAEQHSDSFMSDLVRTRLAQAHNTGTLRALIDGRPPGPAAAPDTSEQDQPRPDDEHPTEGDGEDDDDPPQDGDGDGPTGAGPQGPTGPGPGGPDGARNLLDEVFNRRAS